MELFFHHVGQPGAKKDFPKTIHKKLSIEKLISDNIISDDKLIEELRNRFPFGEFNCWGVPAGAKSVIRNLKEGDYVLLVESSRIDGAVPVLCPIKLFWKYELRALSDYLWQDSKFPFIFFFDTVQIDFLWIEFIEDLGYRENFSPRGNFYKVDSDRLARFGGVEKYVYHLVNNRSNYRGEGVEVNQLNEDGIHYTLLDLQNEEEKITALTKSQPLLLDTSQSRKTVKITKRDQAFSILVKRNYDFKCAICSLDIKSPDGYPALQAAHIFPKEKNGSDDLRNGICLCLFHHWAFDAGWINIDDSYKIIIRKDTPRSEGYKDIFQWENKFINLPKDTNFWPHRVFLSESRKLYGF